MNKIQKVSDKLQSIDELKKSFPLKNSFKTESIEFPYLDPVFTRQQSIDRNYQIYTAEFIRTFSQYLEKKINHYQKLHSSPVTILEVGAGDGRLSKYLKHELSKAKIDDKYQIISTDNKKWENNSWTNKSTNEVINIDYQKALRKYAKKPTIIISCWMNVDVDWTPDFRANTNVMEYILIGDLSRTAYYGKGYFLPPKTNFSFKNLGKEKIIKGLLGRFDGSPHNPFSRTVAYAFIRK